MIYYINNPQLFTSPFFKLSFEISLGESLTMLFNSSFFRENVTLWNELVELRQKHQRQQQIVNKVNIII